MFSLLVLIFITVFSDQGVETNYVVAEKAQDVRIGAFNVQRLGGKKFQNDFVVEYLVKVKAIFFIFFYFIIYDYL